jgi:hypothetical protein
MSFRIRNIISTQTQMAATALIGLALACVCLLMLASSASAANYTWTGASETSHHWSDPANWGGTAPSGTVGTLEFPELIAPACTADPATAACYDTENDVSGLEVNALMLDNAAPYDIDGEAITLGAGGLTASTTSTGLGGNTALGTPIILGASQTWRLDGNDNDSNNVVAGQVSGDSAHTLGISLSYQANLDFGGNVGPVTITGENAANVGSTAGANGAVALSGSSLNGTDGEAVSITDARLDANGPDASVGPLTTTGAFVSVGGLVGGGDLTVDGAATLDSASVLQLSINGPGNGYSQLRASAAINLANAQLVLEGVKPGLVQGECPTLTAGQVDTLITTTGSLVGTFAGVPNGGTMKLSDCTGAVPTMEIHYTAHTVTATPVAPSFTWSGDGYPTTTWSDGANWLGGLAPSSGESIETLTLPTLANGGLSDNNVPNLSVNHLTISGYHDLTGEDLTLGSGGLSLEGSENISLLTSIPLNLSGNQTWTVSGQEGLELSGALTGENSELTINLDKLTALAFQNRFSNPGSGSPDDEVGNVTINAVEKIEEQQNGTSIHYSSEVLLPSRFNATDGHRLTVNNVLLSSSGGTATGPITANHSTVDLSGTSLGPITSMGSHVSLNGNVASLSLDEPSSLEFEIHAPDNSLAEDNETSSGGAIDLGGSELALESYENGEKRCPLPDVGQVHTLITTTGSLSGAFGNAANGGTVVAACVATAEGPTVERVYPYRINYNTGGSTKTVTATALPAVPTAYEEPPTISGTITQEQSLTESHAAWSNKPTGYSYQWQRCDSSGNSCQAITGATRQIYTLTAADVGSTIRVQETASNGEGVSAPQVSAPTAVVQASSGGSSGGSTSGTSTSGTSMANIPVAQVATTRSQPTPAPILGQRQTVSIISGTVSVRLKGTSKFIPFSSASTIPDGSEVEATNGRVLITVATLTPGKTQTAEVWGGRFLIHQEHSGSGETRFILSLPLTGCPRVTLPHGSAAAVAAGAKHSSGPRSRHLWVSEGGGSWGTNGRYVSTTVEGTHWLTVDECDRSEVQVVAGKVRVRNLVNGNAKLLVAGQRYTAVAGRR